MRKFITLAIIAVAFLGATTNAVAEIGLPRVPDAGSSALLLAMAVSGLAAVRSFCKR